MRHIAASLLDGGSQLVQTLLRWSHVFDQHIDLSRENDLARGCGRLFARRQVRRSQNRRRSRTLGLLGCSTSSSEPTAKQADRPKPRSQHDHFPTRLCWPPTIPTLSNAAFIFRPSSSAKIMKIDGSGFTKRLAENEGRKMGTPAIGNERAQPRHFYSAANPNNLAALPPSTFA